MSENKLLVTLDGSGRAGRTIEYLCSFKPLRRREVVLLNIATPVPETYYDLKDGSFGREMSRVKAWEMGQKATMEAFLHDARMRLVAAGYVPDSVQILTKSRKKGIARDIIEEAKKGYDALVIRRRGSNNSLLAVNLGGVAAKLVDKVDSVPLIVAGVQQITHNLCVATDGSEGSLRAVRFVGKMIAGGGCRILLCSVLRDVAFRLSDDDAPVDDLALKTVKAGLEAARAELMGAGIPSECIEMKIVRHAKSRAGALVTAAGEAGCDTLVFGRKGLSRVEDFDIGRIPRKVIYGSRKLTVWLVP